MGKPKKVALQLIKRRGDDGNDNPVYVLLDSLVAKYHAHLAEAELGLRWHYGWKPNKDGHMRLGQCRKGSDLDRELAKFDFIILLNGRAWNDMTDKARAALVDHELCHAQVSYDDDGEPKEDTKGRVVYRTCRHDLEEFNEIVERHGIWEPGIQKFIQAAQASRALPLLDAVDKHHDDIQKFCDDNGASLEIHSGGKKVKIEPTTK